MGDFARERDVEGRGESDRLVTDQHQPLLINGTGLFWRCTAQTGEGSNSTILLYGGLESERLFTGRGVIHCRSSLLPTFVYVALHLPHYLPCLTAPCPSFVTQPRSTPRTLLLIPSPLTYTCLPREWTCPCLGISPHCRGYSTAPCPSSVTQPRSTPRTHWRATRRLLCCRWVGLEDVRGAGVE